MSHDRGRDRRGGYLQAAVLLSVCLMLIVLPVNAWAADLPATDPDTLDEAVRVVRTLDQAGTPRDEIAAWLTGVLDRRMVNVNSFERMSIPGNWLSVFGESAADKAFGEWRDRNDFDYRHTAEWAWENRLSQCSEQANTAYYILKHAGVAGNVRILTAPGHEIAVWGMADGADPNDPTTWGGDAWVVDGWLGKALSAAEAQENPYLKGGTSGNERVIIESTNSFDPEAPPWKVSGSGGETAGEEIDCFVATIAYGTPVAQEIAVLRTFRERVLRPRPAGRAFIGWYERNGPGLARWVARHDTVRSALREGFLRPLDALLRVGRPLWDRPAEEPAPGSLGPPVGGRP